MDFSDKLRAEADYLDEHQEVLAQHNSRWDYPSIYVYADNWEDFQELITHLDGYEKNGSGGSLTATHRELDDDGNTIFRVQVSVSGVCEAKPKLDENGQPVTRKVRTFVETDEEEVVMEYDCPPVWSR